MPEINIEELKIEETAPGGSVEVPESEETDEQFLKNLKSKKKKKKGKLTDLDLEGPPPSQPAPTPPQDSTTAEDLRNAMDDEANEALFGMNEPVEEKVSSKGKNEEEDPDVVDLETPLDLINVKKKKKTPINFDAADGKETQEDSEAEISERPWLEREETDSVRYYYSELLERVFKIIRANNKEVGDGRKKLVIKPPQLSRIGTKKTCFVNFRDTARNLGRSTAHMMSFIFSELGTTGNLDQNEQLILKGKFQPKNMEKVLRAYIKDYVQCKSCKTSDTKLTKQDRLYFVDCNSCKSKNTVQAIKTGFTAVVGKRARIKNALAAAQQK